MTPGLGLWSFARRFGVACVAVSVLLASALLFGDKASKHEFAQRAVVHIDDTILAPQKPAQPANFLLIGHDADGNSDTMMVVHVDPAQPTPLVVSFPRDLIVDIPGHGQGQLNSAIGIGGPALLILTFKTYFDIPINHFIQVDFSSFPQIVSAIGDVDVYFPTPVHDPYIGLDVEHAGCVALNGQMALAYARSRHYYIPKDPANPAPWHWNYAPGIPDSVSRGGDGWIALGSDVDRIPRQQYFMRTLAQVAINRTDDNPLRIIGLVEAVVHHLTTDQTLTLSELKSLVLTFRRLKPADIEMTTLPWGTDPANNNRLVVQYPQANALLFRLANFAPTKPFLPALVNPNTVSVRVVNGSGNPALGTQAHDALAAAGFRLTGPSIDVDGTYALSQVRWAAGRDVQGVTATYATGAKQSGQAAKPTDTGTADVLVVVGKDWDILQHHLTGLAPATAPVTTHTTTPGATANPTTVPTTAPTVTTSTSTTIPLAERGFIPADPKTGGVLVGCPKS